MSNAYPEEIHGIPIGEFVVSLGILLKNPSIQNKDHSKNNAKNIMALMKEKDLTVRGREDVYVAIVVGASYVYNKTLPKESKKRYMHNKSLISSTIKGSSRRGVNVAFPDDSALRQSESSRAAKLLFGDGVVPVVFKDVSLISQALSQGKSGLPIISVKQAPQNLTYKDYSSLLLSLINLYAFYGE